ncbi:uncharacterized protein LOC113569333 isoform X1 [Electrophorus electricus]|uniref:uncharacterized protein LOC113569333 isoform X1 n=1 Tax=Electrophorus electricus TaxID=8005 RepID=UPI0015D01263|nr:uncharacterized protein LOC113569333 isoform X1 [Electrophorus electricus]
MKILLLFILYLISVIEESTSQVTAKSGGGVRIKCKYEEGYETNKKYFCKSEETTCSYQIITEAKHTWVHEDRFSLYDDTNAKVFWVVMRNLTVKDSGTYQCGVDITDKAKEDMHTPVKLKVKAGISTFTMISLVSVFLMLVLKGISYLIGSIRKRSKKQTSSKRQSLQDSSHNQGVSLSVCDYEETKDTRSHSDTGASTVYSTVGLPTKPSYPSQTVYALAQPPSCTHDMDIYSTAQLPTTPSDYSVGGTVGKNIC